VCCSVSKVDDIMVLREPTALLKKPVSYVDSNLNQGIHLFQQTPSACFLCLGAFAIRARKRRVEAFLTRETSPTCCWILLFIFHASLRLSSKNAAMFFRSLFDASRAALYSARSASMSNGEGENFSDTVQGGPIQKCREWVSAGFSCSCWCLISAIRWCC
jgi:hypothetical protein